LEELRTMELVVSGIYGRFAKAFILVVVNGLGRNVHIHSHFILNYLHNIYSWLRCIVLATLQQCWSKNYKLLVWWTKLVANYATIFVILAFDVIVVKRLIKIHNKRIEAQNFTTNFEVCSNWNTYVLKTFSLGNKNNEVSYEC